MMTTEIKELLEEELTLLKKIKKYGKDHSQGEQERIEKVKVLLLYRIYSNLYSSLLLTAQVLKTGKISFFQLPIGLLLRCCFTDCLFSLYMQRAGKERIYEELGFTVNIGVSSNRLLAKMASDFEKPNKVHTLFPEEMETKMWPLPVRDLFMVGPATQKKLNLMGIYTIGDLAKADPVLLRRKLGKHGETIWHYANGRNAELVTPEPAEAKGFGNSVTTAKDVVTTEEAHQVLLSLMETAAMRMRREGKYGSCVSVHLRTNEFRHFSHQSKLNCATSITRELYRECARVFDEMWDKKTPLRQLGVQITELSDRPYQQYDFFSGMTPQQFERKMRLDETVDALRDRFGEDILRRAKFANDPGGHMAGGLDKARRTGITKPIPGEIPRNRVVRHG